MRGLCLALEWALAQRATHCLVVRNQWRWTGWTTALEVSTAPLGYDRVARVVTEHGFSDAFWYAPPVEASLWILLDDIYMGYTGVLGWLYHRGVLRVEREHEAPYYHDMQWWWRVKSP